MSITADATVPLSRRRSDRVRISGRSDLIISSVWMSSSTSPHSPFVAITCSASQRL